jgi:hypothetical protein
VLSVVMMGFLNKFMDGIGVELEQGLFDEVSDTMGPDWTPGKAGADLDPNAPPRSAPPGDGLVTKLRFVPLLPAAIRFDLRTQRGTPAKAPAVSTFLAERFGHGFPVLGTLHSNRARRAIATMLRENLDPAASVVGIDVKLMAGRIYAAVVGDESLAGDIRALARHAGMDGERLDGGAPANAALALARAASSSPSRVDASTIEACRQGGLSAEAIVEVVTWLAVLQSLHRLTCYATPPA